MERQRRVYPARDMKWYSCVLLIAAALLLGVSGILSKADEDGFSLQISPQSSSIPLNERFDDTYATLEFELPSYQWFALQLGVFDNREGAEEFSHEYQKRGAAGYLWYENNFRVLAAAFPLREDAQLVREQLKKQHAVDSHLFSIDFPAVTLRVTGMRGQLDILQAAFIHAHDLAFSLQDMVKYPQKN